MFATSFSSSVPAKTRPLPQVHHTLQFSPFSQLHLLSEEAADIMAIIPSICLPRKEQAFSIGKARTKLPATVRPASLLAAQPQPDVVLRSLEWFEDRLRCELSLF